MEKVLTEFQIGNIAATHWDRDTIQCLEFARDIEQAVLNSEQVQAWKLDAERLDWLLNNLREFHAILFDGATPLMCRGRHFKSADSLRCEINIAMEAKP